MATIAADFSQLPSDPEDLKLLLESLDEDQLREIYEAQIELQHRIATYGPQNDDELHEWIKFEMGVDYPRQAVCEDHNAPFDFIADAYFNRVNAALLMANRGGGKTFMMAVLHWVNARFKPGIESCTFGAVESQSDKCYSHLRGWIYDEDGNKKPQIVSSLRKETVFRNGSKVEVLGSTPEQVNGPHPNIAHADEVELMRDDTWRESRNMTIAGKTKDGRKLIPQDLLTSTRKGPSGRMQALIDEIDDAIRDGYEPPRAFYKYCIKETAQERPNCRMADPEARAARLAELRAADPELEIEDLCDCQKVRKGVWEGDGDPYPKGTPRTLDQICGGDFFRSRGWQPPEEIKKQFRENDRDTFEVQQLCAKPETKFHYFPEYSDARYGIANFIPDPENGPIFTSTDWGGTNPHSVHWYQLLTVEVECDGWRRNPDGTWPRVRLKEGTIVCFDEIYKAEIGNEKLGEMVIDREKEWRAYNAQGGIGFRVRERFADPQGKAAKLDWRDIGLPTRWHTTREFDEHIKSIRSICVDDDLFRIVVDNCPKWRWEVKHWRRHEETGDQIDENNHAMSDFRYAVANIKKIARRFKKNKAQPAARNRTRIAPRVRVTTTRRGQGPLGSRGRDQYAEWRKSLGEPVRMP